MSTRPKSKSLAFLERVSGGPLTFGKMLHAIRRCDEAALKAFACKLGISSSHLCDIEQGRKSVSPKRAASFARILGYSEKQFVSFALQDMVSEAGLNLIVEVKTA
jgi:antitoxin HigA-1